MEIIPAILSQAASELEKYYQVHFPAVAPFARQCFLNTIETTVQERADGTTFVITGDIPAMWLRDSSVQVVNYIPYAVQDAHVRDILRGTIATQVQDICLDPYANAFNADANGAGFQDDTLLNPHVWERKYEVDSLCAPIYLAYSYWKTTQDNAIFTSVFEKALDTIYEVFQREQHHENSPYTFQRFNAPESDTLACDGKGTPVGYTGMTWSGFRPSDDRCEYGYLIPANMMAVVALEKAAEMYESAFPAKEKASSCRALAAQIEEAIKAYGIVEHPLYGKMYAYETDGLGHYNLMDDANVPSLLSLPYLGYCSEDDLLYASTRKFVLSDANPYYFKGRAAQGVGSPHTPKGYIWPIALCMQALTSTESAEVLNCLHLLTTTHADTFFMHESFEPNDPGNFTRPWFAWANTLFASLLIKLKNEKFFEKLSR